MNIPIVQSGNGLKQARGSGKPGSDQDLNFSILLKDRGNTGIEGPGLGQAGADSTRPETPEPDSKPEAQEEERKLEASLQLGMPFALPVMDLQDTEANPEISVAEAPRQMLAETAAEPGDQKTVIPESPIHPRTTAASQEEAVSQESADSKGLVASQEAAASQGAMIPKKALETAQPAPSVEAAESQSHAERYISGPGLSPAQEQAAGEKQAAGEPKSAAGEAGKDRVVKERLGPDRKAPMEAASWGKVQAANIQETNVPVYKGAPEKSIPVRTAPQALPLDVGKALAANMPQKDGTLTIELEPASLGKLTIKVIYEAGKAAVSILAENPKTLELLSRNAGEIAGILKEKTGQETVVYTQQPPEEQPKGHQGGHQDEGKNQRRREERQAPHSESFIQQLRLGLA